MPFQLWHETDRDPGTCWRSAHIHCPPGYIDPVAPGRSSTVLRARYRASEAKGLITVTGRQSLQARRRGGGPDPATSFRWSKPPLMAPSPSSASFRAGADIQWWLNDHLRMKRRAQVQRRHGSQPAKPPKDRQDGRRADDPPGPHYLLPPAAFVARSMLCRRRG